MAKVSRVLVHAGLLAAFALSGCSSGGTTPPAPLPSVQTLHDVYEAHGVPLLTEPGTGTLVFALSEMNTVVGLTGEIAEVGPGTVKHDTIPNGSVTHGTTSVTVSGAALDEYTNRRMTLSGTVSGNTFTFSVDGSAAETATRVAPYVDYGETFAAPSGFVATRTYAPQNTTCANGLVYVAVSGAQADGNGLWRPTGYVSVGSAPSQPYLMNDGIWDGANVFAIEDLGGLAVGPAVANTVVTLTAFPSSGSDGGFMSNGTTSCTTSLTP